MTAILDDIILGLALLLFGGIAWTVCELVAKAMLRRRTIAKWSRDVQP